MAWRGVPGCVPTAWRGRAGWRVAGRGLPHACAGRGPGSLAAPGSAGCLIPAAVGGRVARGLQGRRQLSSLTRMKCLRLHTSSQKICYITKLMHIHMHKFSTLITI